MVVQRDFGRVVVTGGAGFIGSHLCERLCRSGVEVWCLDSMLTGTAENVAQLRDDPLFHLIRCDVTTGMDVPGPVDLVLHLASPASPVDYMRLPIPTLKAGSLGTMHALDLAARKGARFLLASTSEVYGDPLLHPQPETYWGNVNPIGPRSVYDEAKRFAEAVTSAYRRSGWVDSVIVRIFNTYGPRMRSHDGRAVPTFIRQALAGEPLTVAGDGLQTRSLCYVDDTVEGIIAAAASGHPGPVNIGNPEETTILDLARRVRTLARSRSSIVFIERPVDDPAVRRPDIALARTLLDWHPKVSSVDGLARTVAWFSRQAPARTAAHSAATPRGAATTNTQPATVAHIEPVSRAVLRAGAEPALETSSTSALEPVSRPVSGAGAEPTLVPVSGAVVETGGGPVLETGSTSVLETGSTSALAEDTEPVLASDKEPALDSASMAAFETRSGEAALETGSEAGSAAAVGAGS